MPSFPDISANYYCTAPSPAPSSSAPTIYLATSPAHGIVDFLGLQYHLSLPPHRLRSCSFDPPSFGWSVRFPASAPNVTAFYNDVFAALVARLEEGVATPAAEGGPMAVLAGWGAGTATVVDAARRPELAARTAAVVLLGASVPDAEFWDLQRRNNWTVDETALAKKQELTARTGLARVILALGVPWYVCLFPLLVSRVQTAYCTAR